MHLQTGHLDRPLRVTLVVPHEETTSVSGALSDCSHKPDVACPALTSYVSTTTIVSEWNSAVCFTECDFRQCHYFFLSLR